MKRVILAIVSTISGLVMLLSFKTQAVSPSVAAAAVVAQPVPTASATATTSSSSGATTAGRTTTAATPSPSAVTPTTAASTATKTVTGASVDTRWGPVQVQVTVTNGKITSAQAVVYPQQNPRDQQINAYAVPTLNSEAVAANSASIDMVSGATYTSNGYITSLQSALDKL